MTPRSVSLVALSALALLVSADARELDVLKDTTEKWIRARNQISEEMAAWNAQKQLLQGSISTLESTEQSLADNVQILELQTAKLREEKEQAESQIAEAEQRELTVVAKVEGYEARILELARKLPEPLKEQLRPLLRKIPEPGGSAPTSPSRLQNVVAITTLIDEFNNDLKLAHTIKPLPDGSFIEVKVLYWGIAVGYASSVDGSRAWILKPAPDEWQWVETTENAIAIKQLFDVYDKSIDPQLVSVPFTFAEAGGLQ